MKQYDLFGHPPDFWKLSGVVYGILVDHPALAEDLVALTDATKARAAHQGVAYDSRTIAKAIDSELFKRKAGMTDGE